MPEEGFGPQDSGDYNFGATAPPEGFDPNTSAPKRPDAGEHTMTITTFTMHPDHTFKWKGESYALTQLRPTLVVTSPGSNEGRECIDFLPMPTEGREMGLLANRWANLLKGFGFNVTKDSLVPVGFKLTDLIGRSANVTIQEETDSDNQPKKYRGVVQTGVALFGYSPVDEATKGPDATPTAAEGKPKPFDL